MLLKYRHVRFVDFTQENNINYLIMFLTFTVIYCWSLNFLNKKLFIFVNFNDINYVVKLKYFIYFL